MRFMLAFLCFVLVALPFACGEVSTTNSVPGRVSIIVEISRAPISVLRSTLRSLEDLTATAQSADIEILLGYECSSDFVRRQALQNLLNSRAAFKKFLFTEFYDSSLSAILNSLAQNATGDYLLFLSELSQIDSDHALTELVSVLDARKADVGAVTAKILGEDGLVFAAGIDFVYARNPNKQSTNMWGDYGAGNSWRGGGGSSGSSRSGGRYNSWRSRSGAANNRWGTQQDPETADDTALQAPSATAPSAAAHEEAPVAPPPVAPASTSQSEVPVALYRWQGYSPLDARVTQQTQVPAAPFWTLALRRELFWRAGGFNASALPWAYFDVDLCLRLQQQWALSTLYVPSAVTRMALLSTSASAEEEHVAPEGAGAAPDEDAAVSVPAAADALHLPRVKSALAAFTDTWFTVLQERLDATLRVRNMTLVWNMDCGGGQVLGFTTEALSLVLSLHRHVRVKLVVANVDECRRELRRIGFPLQSRKLFRWLEGREDRLHASEPVVAVLHKDPGRYGFSLFQEPFRSASRVIGRSMYETTSIPASWTQPCNADVDEIWVPTPFNHETFGRAGVNASRIAVVPELIDMSHFDPQAHLPFTGWPATSRAVRSPPPFRFLTLGKWEKRKGWDTLLEAYFDEFRAVDATAAPTDVLLVFRANMAPENHKQFNDFVKRYCAKRNVTASVLPPVEFLGVLLPYSSLPSLYRSADAFVMATHGEGWGLPLMEAMSMELPTIATNWSGNTAFMTRTNSFLVAVDKLVQAPDLDSAHQWAQPSLASLRHHLRFVFDHRAAAKERGKLARQYLLDHFAHQGRDVILDKLTSLSHEDLARAKAARESRAEANSWGASFQYGGPPVGSTTGNTWSSWNGGNTQQTFVDSLGRTRTRIKINP